MKLPSPTAEQVLGRSWFTFGRGRGRGDDGSGIVAQDCSLGKQIGCLAGGLAAAVAACGLGVFALTPPCLLALDQLAAIGCCDCLPDPLAGACRNL